MGRKRIFTMTRNDIDIICVIIVFILICGIVMMVAFFPNPSSVIFGIVVCMIMGVVFFVGSLTSSDD